MDLDVRSVIRAQICFIIRNMEGLNNMDFFLRSLWDESEVWKFPFIYANYSDRALYDGITEKIVKISQLEGIMVKFWMFYYSKCSSSINIYFDRKKLAISSFYLWIIDNPSWAALD